MKKLILFWGLALGLSGLSYGMDQTPQQKQGSFQNDLNKKHWDLVSLDLVIESGSPIYEAYKSQLMAKIDEADGIAFCYGIR